MADVWEVAKPTIYFVISKQIPVDPESAIAQELPEGATEMTGVFYMESSLEEFNKTFAVHGIPDGWSVTAIPKSISGDFISKSPNLPSNLVALSEAPLIYKGLHVASWKQEFCQYFRLRTDYTPY